MGNKENHTFPKGISLQVNGIEEMELEIAYYNIIVQYISNYARHLNIKHRIMICFCTS